MQFFKPNPIHTQLGVIKNIQGGNMPDIIRDLLLITIVIVLFDIRNKIKMIDERISRVWDILPKRVGDEFPD